MMIELLKSLNPEQLAAVTHEGGPLLIIAGPGTGKTKTLATRIAWLIRQCRAEPSQVLACTFSNRAAEEMRERLQTLLPDQVAQAVNLGTFHAVCWQILRRELSRDWSICPHDTQIAIVRHVLSGSSSIGASAHKKVDPEKLLAVMSRHKGSLVDIASGQLPDEAVAQGLTPLIATAYQTKLEQCRLLDFDDLVLRTVRLFEQSAGILTRYRTRFRHIAVDESQDTNAAQFRLIELLAEAEGHRSRGAQVDCDSAGQGSSSLPSGFEQPGDGLQVASSLTVIGDPDQAIYGFRGASGEYFREFERRFPGTRLVRLVRCYRSSPQILDAALAVLRRNEGRSDAQLESHAARGPKVMVQRLENEEVEANFVVREIRLLMGGLDRQDFDTRVVPGDDPEENYGFADFAVLYRLHAVGAALVQRFTRSGIPFQQIGGPLLREQAETRRLIETLRALVNAHGRTGVEHPDRDGPAHRSSIAAEELRASCNADSPAREAIRRVGQHLDKSPDPHTRLACERLLAHVWAERETLSEFLDRLDTERHEDLHDPRADKVTLMTLHAAKGLEFDVVFLVGCERGVLPYSRRDDSGTGRFQKEQPAQTVAAAEVEEERRLFYVGMTRARRRLFVSWTADRLLFGARVANRPSPFLAEIPASMCGSRSMLPGTRAARPRGAMQRKLFLP